MANTRQGSLRLFQFAGIDVFVHWSWLLVAWFELSNRPNNYQMPLWNVIEYLSIFGIVTLHEFGHALACRQVGGTANTIMLWPLGGAAFVQAPPRAGAQLWSIAAGPLVNVALVPITVGLMLVGTMTGLEQSAPDAARYLSSVAMINAALLFFNMLPIYPLDGGQVMQALLWFVVGRAWSLLLASLVGLVAGLGLVGVCIWFQDGWLALIAVFITWRGIAGFRQGLALWRMMRVPRHAEFACPACGASPPVGDYWACGKCHTRFDTFSQGATCPGCGEQFPVTQCSHCHTRSPITQWSSDARRFTAPAIDAEVVVQPPDPLNPYASPKNPG